MLKVAGIVLLVALILVGALMPLKYTARMQKPRPRPDDQVDTPGHERRADRNRGRD